MWLLLFDDGNDAGKADLKAEMVYVRTKNSTGTYMPVLFCVMTVCAECVISV